MNKYIKYIGMVSLLCFSFYYTEQLALFMQKKDPIYESILVLKEEYEVKSINAIIEDNYIIPGLMGQQVDVNKSFQNMKNVGFFTEQKLIFEQTEPNISVKEHQDKIIKQGNSSKNAISFIVTDEKIIDYFEEMGIFYTELTTKENMKKHRKYGSKLNNDSTNYKIVEKYLKESSNISKYCYYSEDFCQKNKKQTIEETVRINNSNFVETYRKIQSGYIIYLQDNFEITNLKILLNKIYFQGLTITSLDNLLSEGR